VSVTAETSTHKLLADVEIVCFPRKWCASRTKARKPKTMTMESITGKPIYEENQPEEDVSDGSVSDYVISGGKRTLLALLKITKKSKFTEHPISSHPSSSAFQKDTSKSTVPLILLLTPSNETPNLNRGLQAAGKLSVKHVVVRTRAGIAQREPIPLAQFLDIPGRDYEASIESEEAHVTYGPQPGGAKMAKLGFWDATCDAVDGYLETIKTRRVRVWSAALP
jgi:hypothetical protein